MSLSSKVTDYDAGTGKPATTVGIIDLRILATTDLHGHLRGYDYSSGKTSHGIGLSRIATLIEEARVEQNNTMLFDNGDFLQGTQLVDFWARERIWAKNDVHPMITAMNALRYDAHTLGNHEFNFGIPYLERILQDADFPTVLANITATDESLPSILPWTILRRTFVDRSGTSQHVNIGIIGFLPPQTITWDSKIRDRQITGQDLIRSAEHFIPKMIDAGADVIIALAHTGIETTPSAYGKTHGENVGVQLAHLPGIDAMICGHSHLIFPDPARNTPDRKINTEQGTIDGTVSIMPGHHGSHLGIADLVLKRNNFGRWRPINGKGSLRHALAPEHSDIIALSAHAHGEITAHLEQTLGDISVPINSFFGLVAPTPAIDIVAKVQASCAQKHLAQTPDSALPLLSVVSLAKTGGRSGPNHFIDIPAGPLTLRNVMDLYAFPDIVSALRVTGAEIVEWLEHAAGIFNQIKPEQRDAPLLNPDFPSYNFDVMTGLRYEIDITRPPRYHPHGALANRNSNRIRSITHNGTPITADQVFMVATNNFRSSGVSGFPLVRAEPIMFEKADLRMLLHQQAKTDRMLPIDAARTWHFTPIPGATTWFDTAPAARNRLHEAIGIRIEEIGLSSQGFLRVRLHM